MPSDGGKLRINQFLARAGLASRRAAEALIREGHVTLNGQTITDLATTVTPGKDFVKVDGRGIRLPDRGAYFALYKPKEVVSTLDDPEGRPCLKGLLPPGAPGLFPVGRLDYHSEGLLLLTDWGDLQHLITDPRRKTPKTYLAQVEGAPAREAIERLRRGVRLQDGMTRPTKARLIEPPAVWPRNPPVRFRKTIPTAWIELTITEGRNRQVRRMTAAVGHPTLRLIRARVGEWELGSLVPGEWRQMWIPDAGERE